MPQLLKKGTRIDRGRYEVLRQLGRGSFSEVYLVRNTRSGVHHAFKVNLPHEALQRRAEEEPVVKYKQAYFLSRDGGHAEVTENEVRVLKELEGRNIAELLDVVPLEEIDTEGILFGKTTDKIRTLRQHIDRTDYSMDYGWSYNKFIVRKINRAMHMSLGDYLHKDLKPDNILINKDMEDELVLIDFGVSTKFDKPNHLWGSKLYSPPEAYTDQQHEFSDWWHFGLIAFETMQGMNFFDYVFNRLPESKELRRMFFNSEDHLDFRKREDKGKIKDVLEAIKDEDRFPYDNTAMLKTTKDKTIDISDVVGALVFIFRKKLNDPNIKGDKNSIDLSKNYNRASRALRLGSLISPIWTYLSFDPESRHVGYHSGANRHESDANMLNLYEDHQHLTRDYELEEFIRKIIDNPRSEKLREIAIYFMLSRSNTLTTNFFAKLLNIKEFVELIEENRDKLKDSSPF